MRQHVWTTLGSGVAIGYLLGRTPWFVLVIGIIIGYVIRDLYAAARWTAMAMGAAWGRKHPEKLLARKLLRGRIPY